MTKILRFIKDTIILLYGIIIVGILFSPIPIVIFTGNWWYLFLFGITPLIATIIVDFIDVVFSIPRPRFPRYK